MNPFHIGSDRKSWVLALTEWLTVHVIQYIITARRMCLCRRPACVDIKLLITWNVQSSQVSADNDAATSYSENTFLCQNDRLSVGAFHATL